jgi:cytochrome c oxidase subunit 1
MIAKQYLITGIIMGIIGVECLCFFECNWHGLSSLSKYLMFYWVINGLLTVWTNDIYLSLVTIHGTIMVFFVLTAALSGTLATY